MVWENAGGGWRIVDTYGLAVVDWTRHSNCCCEVPCQGRFDCDNPFHVGGSAMPWCVGMGGSEECDVCWYRRDRIAAKLRRARQVGSIRRRGWRR